MKTIADRLAVCSWSLQPGTPEELAVKLEEVGIRRVQLALDPLTHKAPAWIGAAEHLRQRGIDIVSGMFGCAGEDYSTLESIRSTGGVAPDSTWEQNRKDITAAVQVAVRLGLKLVTFHAGFLPHDDSAPEFQKMLRRLAEVADVFGEAEITLGFETGQESGVALRKVLTRLNKKNVGINFDPANMILYDKGDPVEALGVLGPWLRQVHIKDAVRTRTPGTWGEEVPVGTGQVNWPAFLGALQALKFGGDLVIEREAGNQRVRDIRTAREVLERLGA